MNGMPKYLRIHEDLRERISGGQWPPGSVLPSQQELAAEFGVSVMTLRQALQLLADDGLIQVRHGRGTFVAARYGYDLGHLRGFAADLAGQGARITTTVLSAGVVVPPPDVSARLGAADEVLRLRRLRSSGQRWPSAGRAVIVQTSYLPAGLADTVRAADLAVRGLYSVLADCGRAVARASETITPVTLGPRDARDLGRAEGSPALLSHQVSFTADGTPVIDDHAVLAGDSVSITASRSRDGLDVRYALTG